MSRLIHYLFYILFFFTPLIFWPKTSELFEFNKMLFVYLITGFILTAWAVKSVLDKKLVIIRSPLDIPILLFLASQIISTAISIDPHTSLWGYYSRFHGGLVSTICYISLYYALVSNFSTLNSRLLILNSILSSSFLVSIYAILEHFGIDKHLWVQDVQSRVFSTLGQPNWLSAYLLAILPLPIFKIFENRNENRSKLENRAQSSKGASPLPGVSTTFSLARFSYLVLSILILVSILFTRSQSGLFATAIILPLSIFFSLPKTYRKRSLWMTPIFLIVCLLYQIPLVAKITTFTSVFEGTLSQAVDHDNTTRFGGSNSMLIRRVVWTGAIDLAKKYPLFGTGVETFGYTYYWVRPPEHNLLSEWDFLYNKAHNEYLNVLANTGFVGLATYLLLICSIIKVFVKPIWAEKIRAQHAPASREPVSTNFTDQNGLLLALLLSFISILITNFFGFSVVTIGLFFFLFPAIAIIDSTGDSRIAPTITIPIAVPQSITISIIIFFALTWSIRVGRSFSADLAYNQGKAYLSIGSLEPALKFLSLASKNLPSEPLFFSALGEAQAQAAATVNQQLTNLSATDSAKTIAEGKRLEKAFLESSKANSEKALSLNKYQTNFYKTKAKTELYLSIIDPAYRQEALKTLVTLSSYTPTDAKVFYNIGLIQQELGNSSAALVAYRQALNLKPDFQTVKNLLSPPSL